MAYKIVSYRPLTRRKGVTGMETPELWQFTSSHFNEKARWALDFKRVPHIRHSLIPGFHVPVVKRMTGKTHVPVLKLDGKAISDSSRIIEALERAYPEPALYPADADERRRALELEDYFDEELGPYIRRWIFHIILPYPKFVRAAFVSHASPAAQLAQRAMAPLFGAIMRRQMNINPASAEIARDKTFAAMDRLASELRPSGYLAGDRFTVADLTAAALLSPLVRPPEFPYKAAAPLPEPLAKILASASTHPAFQWTLKTYRQHRGESSEVASRASISAIRTDAGRAATIERH
jgi:glutathione S-transferase